MTYMPKTGKTLDVDMKTMVDAIRDVISRVSESDVTTTFKEKLLGSLVGGEGRPRMRCLGTIPAPNAAPGSSHLAPSSSNAAPISLESILEGLMQMIIDKVGEYVLEKARAEARDEVVVALGNFFQTIIAGANNDPNRSSVRAEGNTISTLLTENPSVLPDYRYPFMEAKAQDLRFEDVQKLLGLYKHIVTKYAALSDALSRLSIDQNHLLALQDPKSKAKMKEQIDNAMNNRTSRMHPFDEETD
ncbi:hypothetical protein ZIOFF_008854 [Zingiber officinale]|uniref:Uncharacterized protein n=1 Tax=Zingiber officinale TaxID=94328 RepID=A0A8J5LU20_ZINOF|nr:hypothetical protein ZIOFF_008854 [Zingiber officinale]